MADQQDIIPLPRDPDGDVLTRDCIDRILCCGLVIPASMIDLAGPMTDYSVESTWELGPDGQCRLVESSIVDRERRHGR